MTQSNLLWRNGIACKGHDRGVFFDIGLVKKLLTYVAKVLIVVVWPLSNSHLKNGCLRLFNTGSVRIECFFGLFCRTQVLEN